MVYNIMKKKTKDKDITEVECPQKRRERVFVKANLDSEINFIQAIYSRRL